MKERKIGSEYEEVFVWRDYYDGFELVFFSWAEKTGQSMVGAREEGCDLMGETGYDCRGRWAV